MDAQERRNRPEFGAALSSGKKRKKKKSWFGSFFFVEQEKEDGGGESYGAAATDQYQEHSVCVRCVLIPRGRLAGRASMVAAASK